MALAQRQFKLTIWGLALGYFCFYAPYSAFIKVTTGGLWPGVSSGVSGFRLLPAVVISTAIVMTTIVSFKGWWQYASRRQFFGLSIPFPSNRLVLLSGFGTAIIIGTTTLTFTYTGVSIVFALLLMRGGVLIIAPVVDRLFKRRVRWFSWAAFAVTVPAILIALADVNNYRLTTLASLTIVAYLTGYVLRIPCVTSMAKSTDPAATYRYFVEEQLAAMFFLLVIPAVFALIGKGEIMSELRLGFTGLFAGSVTLPALIIGALYACLYCFGTLIYLDCRENTFCIPLNRGSSLLAGLFASYVLALFYGQRPPSAAQLGGAGLIAVALLFLSPLHHPLRTFGYLGNSLARVFRALVGVAAGGGRQPVNSPGAQAVPAGTAHAFQQRTGGAEQADKPRRRLFLFVCSGNTCRSPMAAAIANAEIAARMKIPFETLETVNAQALSAGVTARTGAPLTPEAQQALRSLDVPVRPHAARNLTEELAEQAEMIFCMTAAHRQAVIELLPSVAGKTFCLDPAGDIADPIGSPLEAYLQCAAQLRELIRRHLDKAQLSPSF